MVVFLYLIWIVIVLWSSYKVDMRCGISIVVKPHDFLPSLSFFLSFVFLPPRNDANLCSLRFNLQSILPGTEVYE